MTPPATLGDPEPEPPLDALPRPLVELIAMVQVSLKYMGMDGATIGDPMTGTGIGSVELHRPGLRRIVGRRRHRAAANPEMCSW